MQCLLLILPTSILGSHSRPAVCLQHHLPSPLTLCAATMERWVLLCTAIREESACCSQPVIFAGLRAHYWDRIRAIYPPVIGNRATVPHWCRSKLSLFVCAFAALTLRHIRRDPLRAQYSPPVSVGCRSLLHAGCRQRPTVRRCQKTTTAVSTGSPSHMEGYAAAASVSVAEQSTESFDCI
jgi:hypothetical protein